MQEKKSRRRKRRPSGLEEIANFRAIRACLTTKENEVENTVINELEVNGKTYVLKGTERKDLSGNVKIVILQRGWVFVGRFSKIGQDCKLENAYCIRQWGTTKGLGELVDGPTSKTVLDGAGTVEFNELTIVAKISASEDGWNKKC
jgi:hypothetical protein